MRPGLTDRRQRAERRLFDVSARLDRARAELEVIEAQLDALVEQADEAKVRAIVAETPLATQVFTEAQRHADQMAHTRDAARLSIAELERAQDELIGDLLV
jgi:chromosome segregation ATPase